VVQVVDTKSYFLDAGVLEMDDGSGNYVSLGATMDNNVYRVRQVKFAPVLNNVKGTVKGTERIVTEVAELEVSIPEISAARLALMVPGVTVTVSPITDTGSGIATTLSAASLPGDQTVHVTLGTGITVGQFFRVEAANNAAVEHREVQAISGTTVTLDRPLVNAHASAVVFVQTQGDGRSTITGSGSRIPDEAYHDYRLRVDSDEGLFDLYVFDALNIADAAEMTLGSASQAAPRLTLQSRYDPANTAIRPWRRVTP
jgi:hypothetical protein